MPNPKKRFHRTLFPSIQLITKDGEAPELSRDALRVLVALTTVAAALQRTRRRLATLTDRKDKLRENILARLPDGVYGWVRTTRAGGVEVIIAPIMGRSIKDKRAFIDHVGSHANSIIEGYVLPAEVITDPDKFLRLARYAKQYLGIDILETGSLKVNDRILKELIESGAVQPLPDGTFEESEKSKSVLVRFIPS